MFRENGGGVGENGGNNEQTKEVNGSGSASRELSVIRLIHRADDGYISFHRIAADCFSNLFSIQAGDLQKMTPRIMPDLGPGGLFTVNGFMRRYGKSKVVPGLPGPFRREDGLRYLNACFVDLDYYKAGLNEAQALHEVRRLEAAGIIPPVSITLNSGQGLWVFWLLCREDDSSQPPRAFPKQLDEYRRIQQALKERLAHLAADATDAVRTVRIPGGINAKSGKRVTWTSNSDATGKPPAYTMLELRERLGINAKKRHQTPNVALNDAQREARRKGHRSLNTSRLEQFEKLRAIRGGFSEGCRNRAALLYVTFLRGRGVDLLEIEHRVEHLASECHPPLRSAARDALKSGLKPKSLRFTDQRIAQWLDITPDESAQLNGWPPALRFGHVKQPAPTRQEHMDNRRKLIRAIIDMSGGAVPSTRAMKAALSEHGHEASPQTIANDYEAMGLKRQPAMMQKSDWAA